jgi:glucokinase
MTGVGLDVGGSSMRASAGGRVVRKAIGRQTSLAEFIAIARSLLDAVDPERSARVVVALPTFVENGVLLECPAIPAIQKTRLASLLSDHLDRPLPLLVPDLAAAAIGEARAGSGIGVERFLCVAIGTGANAAATRNGNIVDTVFGSLGDAGHVLVDPGGPACACGGRGCLEAVTGGWALARDARALGLNSAADLSAAADAGDAQAAAIIDHAGVCLGRAISTWSVMTWPSVVAIAGGVAAAGERLLNPARRELKRIAPPYIGDGIQIVPALLGGNATLEGARLLALD